MIILLLLLITYAFAQFPLNTSLIEQYACILASNQFVPAQSPESPFMGIFYMTVQQIAASQFLFNTFLYHNVDYATDAQICGPAPRGKVNGSTCFIPLYQAPQTANSRNCPLYSSMVVYQDVVDALRQGLLFAEVTSGQPSGQLRGQIETRNDIFFAPIQGKTNTTTIVGAGLIRLFDIYGNTFSNPQASAGVDMYVISNPDYNNDAIQGLSVITNITGLLFGNLTVSNMVANTIYEPAIVLLNRDSLERQTPPMYGPTSANMLMYALDFSIPIFNDTSIVPTYVMGRFIRLPLLKFNGNEVFVFTQTGGGSFGGGGGGGGQPSSGFRADGAPEPVVSVIVVALTLFFISALERPFLFL